MLSNCDLVSNVSPLLIFCRYQMKCKSVSNVSPRYICRERFSQIGRALTNKKSDDRDAIAAVSELIAEVGQSKRLADAGAKPEHYSAWAQAALEDICLRSNPRTATQAQIIDLYAAAG